MDLTEQPYSQFCAQLRQQQLLRRLPKNLSFEYDFSHNDYLGFSQNPLLAEAAIEAAEKKGVGSKASRLITFEQKNLQDLEQQIARSKGSQTALLFATGFQANVSVLSALLDLKVLAEPPLVFADRLNHASMHVACQHAKASQLRFRHNDYEHLEYLLNKFKYHKQPKFILTESVFGMDGDVANLTALHSLAKQHKAFCYVDEAHATGLFGQQGYGFTADYQGEIDVCMGTFSKALGSQGAYVACSHTLKRYFINRCSGLIYSTAPSPVQIALMQKAWDLIPSYQTLVQKLMHTAEKLRSELTTIGYDCGNSTTHIIPVILRTPEKTLKAQKFLAKHGIRVSAIRSPSVPPQQSRLRIALSVTHSEQAVITLIEKLRDLKNLIL